MKRALVILFSCLGMALSARAQSIKQFTVDDGLPSSNIYEVKQDRKGFYWISTDAGVVRYDGYSLKRMTGEFSKDIWWTYEDADDVIWSLSVGRELAYLSEDSVYTKKVTFADDEHKTSISKLFQDRFGYYWMIAGSMIFRFKDDEYSSIMYNRDLVDFSKGVVPLPMPTLHQEESGDIYLLTNYPITVWRADSLGAFNPVWIYQDTLLSAYSGFIKQKLGYPYTLPDLMNSMAENPWVLSEKERTFNDFNTTVIYHNHDSLYIIHNGFVRALLNGTTKDLGQLLPKEIMPKNHYRVIRLPGKYVFIQNSGNFMTDYSFNHLPEYDFLKNYNINTVYEDYEGSLWVSTTSQGLLFVTKDAVQVAQLSPANVNGSRVIGIHPSSNGSVWVGYNNGYLCHLSSDSLECFETDVIGTRDPNNILRDFRIIDNSLIAMVGHYELHEFHLNTDGQLARQAKLLGTFETTKTLNDSRSDKLYLQDYWGTSEVAMVSGDKTIISRIRRSRALAATVDEENDLIYISSYDGLYALSPSGDSIMLDESFLARKFNTGPGSTLWAVGRTSGVCLIDNRKARPIKALENTLVNDIDFEGDSVLWVATNEGAIMLERSSENNRFDIIRRLTLANGLPTNNVTAIYSDEEFIYVGTAEGFSRISKTVLNTQPVGHKVILTKAVSRGLDLGIADSYVLQPDYNSLEINYVYISPKSAGQILYYYKLDGIETEWQQTDETRIHYPFLPPGDYTFHLWAKDINGVPSSGEITLQVSVEEYWWKTTWFMALVISLVLTIVFFIFLSRFRRLRARDRERAEMDNRIAELKLNALQSQMNPHFVFNVLNSIQDGFINNNFEEANRNLSDFSKLMRLFLESSDDRYITIAKEIQLLRYYIELERMRLDNKFEFEFILDDNVDPEEFRIPTMLLQPIIENSILHGLRYKDGKGLLTVSFEFNEGGILMISIEDNGVGRKKSEEINKNRKKDHVSKATGIIKDRIEIINSSGNDRIDIQYIDLMEGEVAMGLRVELKLDLEINR